MLAIGVRDWQYVMETQVTDGLSGPVPPQSLTASNHHEVASPKWRERVAALKNIPPVLRMVWEAAPGVIAAGLACRVLVALIPLAALAVTRVIVNDIVDFRAHGGTLPHNFWWLVALEFTLAGVLAGILIRMVNFFEIVLADRYSKHISTKIMEHASRLDLTSFEDPLFYDKMERARVQGTDRIVMIQSTGMLIQQIVTTMSLAGGIIFLSPWILAVLVACVIPAFLGETHFAFMGYSLNFKQTPAKREMDYLRIIGGSKESAKELKLFGLAPFLVGRYTKLSNELHAENVGLAKRRLWVGAAFTLLGRARILRKLRLRDLQDGYRKAGYRHVYVYDRRDCAGQLEYPSGVHDLLNHRGSSDVHHRPAGLFRSAAAGLFQAKCTASSAADSDGI